MKIERLLNMLAAPIPIAYDVETNGLRWQEHTVCGYSVSDGNEAYYVPVRHDSGNISDVDSFEAEIARIISQRREPLITHNGKFDSHMSLNHGIELGNRLVDTLIGANLLDENQFGYSLEKVAGLYPDIPQKKGKALYEYMGQLMGLPAKQDIMGQFWRLSGHDKMAVEYAEGDTLTTWHVREKQKKEIYAQNLDLVYDIENRLIHVLRKMERRGVRVDMDALAQVREEIDKIQYDMHLELPVREDLTPMNVRSGKDLKEYFEQLNFTQWEFTKPTERHPNGQPSFNKGFLGLTDEGQQLLRARAVDHFKNGFIDPIDKYIYDGVIYTNFNQSQQEWGSGTKSGRLSSNYPNMQQIPKRDEFLGAIFRRIFIPHASDRTFMEYDFSQCEPRLFSHYSDEPVLIEGYNSIPAIDMHDVAARYMNIERKTAKSLNLGLMYTMGIAKLAKQLGISETDAKIMYNNWKKTFPNVASFTKLASQVAEQRGYVKTILGRRARFPDPRWAYRAANRIVQGGSADILKYKMVQLDDWLVEEKLEQQIMMLLNIHDAILFDASDDALEYAKQKIKQIMESVNTSPFSLKVPFVVDYKLGKDWKAATYE